MEAGKSYIVAIYDDEEALMGAIPEIRKNGIRIHEVFTPYPVHGLAQALGYKRSRLPVAAFLFGLFGCLFGIWMQVWMLGFDWPMIIGGKDFVAFPSFVPAIFELTVLISALGMVGTFLIISDLKPHRKPLIFDLRSSDDKMVMAIDLALNRKSSIEIQTILQNTGASEILIKEFELKNA